MHSALSCGKVNPRAAARAFDEALPATCAGMSAYD